MGRTRKRGLSCKERFHEDRLEGSGTRAEPAMRAAPVPCLKPKKAAVVDMVVRAGLYASNDVFSHAGCAEEYLGRRSTDVCSGSPSRVCGRRGQSCSTSLGVCDLHGPGVRMRTVTAALFMAVLLAGPGCPPVFPGLTAACAAEAAGQAVKGVSQADLEALAGSGRWLELVSAASDMESKNPSDPAPVLFGIKALRMLGRLDAALARSEDALRRFPDDNGILLERAWIRAFRGEWAPALDDARRVSQKDPRQVDALMLQGIACREMRSWDDAIGVFTKVLNVRGSDADALLNRGRAYLEKGMWTQAITDLGSCLAQRPDSAEALYHRGRAWAGAGRPMDACRDFTRAIMLRPEAPQPYIARADALARSGDWRAASRDAYTAITLGSRDPKAYLIACRASVALGDWDALAEYAASGAAMAPADPDFHRFLGRAYRERGEPEKAVQSYDRALKEAPGDPAILLERSAACMMLRRYAQAESDCSAALARGASARAYSMRGIARLKLGNPDGALEDGTNALFLDPGSSAALLVQANADLLLNRPSDAASASLKALRIDPGQPWALVTCGASLLALGRAEEALKLLDEAASIAPGDPEAHLARGRCLAALGREPEARKDLEQAAALDDSLRDAVSLELSRLAK